MKLVYGCSKRGVENNGEKSKLSEIKCKNYPKLKLTNGLKYWKERIVRNLKE